MAMTAAQKDKNRKARIAQIVPGCAATVQVFDSTAGIKFTVSMIDADGKNIGAIKDGKAPGPKGALAAAQAFCDHHGLPIRSARFRGQSII